LRLDVIVGLYEIRVGKVSEIISRWHELDEATRSSVVEEFVYLLAWRRVALEEPALFERILLADKRLEPRRETLSRLFGFAVTLDR
jgi:hypothetical protein